MDAPELKIDGKSVTSIVIDGKEVTQIEADGRIIYKKSEPVLLDYFYIENVDETSGSISFENMAGKDIEYSTDGNEWTVLDLTSGSATIGNVEPGAKVYLRGTNEAVGSSTSGKHISADFNHNLGGNICSLLDEENFENITAISTQYAFANLFYFDDKLISSDFNIGVVTSIGDYGFAYAFRYCLSLIAAPDLSNLTSIGERWLLYAFDNCRNLTTAPDLSNVTSIEDYGLAYAFMDCYGLTTPPDLSNVTSIGANGLYEAFYGCRSLTTAPDISNITTIGSYGLGFAFYECYKLETIYVPNLDTWETSKFGSWVQSAGTQATNPQMIFQTQALLDACPSGISGSGSYSKILAS